MGTKRKYEWTRGEDIEGTYFRYLREAGYTNKHRHLLVQCKRCGMTKVVRLDKIASGKAKSCGCYHDQLVEEGKLTKFAVSARKKNPRLQRGGKRFGSRVLLLELPAKYWNRLKHLTLEEIFNGAEIFVDGDIWVAR